MGTSAKIIKYIDDSLRIPVLSEGDKLYHYTSAAGLQGICEKEFWVTERNFLNDRTEFQIGTEVFCQVLETHMSDTTRFHMLEEKLKAEVERLQTPGKLGEKAAYYGDYVISFCLDNDSTLMWSEYSDFMGYCLRFDFQKLLEAFQETGILHGKVVYDHEEQFRLLEDMFVREFLNDSEDCKFLRKWEDLDSISEKGADELINFVSVMVSAYNMFFKKMCFSGEHEYRFVFMCAHDGGRYRKEDFVPQYFRLKQEVLIPYVKKRLDSMDCLEAVLIGPKNNSDIAVKGLEYFFRNKKLPVSVERSEMPLRY